MREEKEHVLKAELRVLALKTRDSLGLTQREMAERLSMSENSYSDIETGAYMCGTLTTVLLLMEHEDANKYLEYLKKKFQELYDKELHRV